MTSHFEISRNNGYTILGFGFFSENELHVLWDMGESYNQQAGYAHPSSTRLKNVTIIIFYSNNAFSYLQIY